MPRVPIPLIGPSYQNRSLPLSAQVSKGLFPEINPEARNIVSLHAFPGLKLFSDNTGVNRGSHVMDGVAYEIFGESLLSIDENGVASNKGEVEGQGICDMADNGDQMFIATGNTPYLYTASTDTLEIVTDTSVKKPTTVDYMNAQFILDHNDDENPVLGEFVTSQLTGALTADDFVNSLDFAEAQSHPDDISRIKVYNEMVYFFGTEGIESWWNSGVGSPPFDKVQGASRTYGLGAKWSLTETDEFLYFLDDQRIPRRMFGLQVSNIGNPALGAEWTKYSRVDNAIGYAFTIDQTNFYQLTFPSADRTWLYHEPSNSWFQLSFGTDNQRHRGHTHVFAYGKNLIADHSNGNLYELDADTYTDNGEVIQRRRSTATIHGGLYDAPGKEIFFDRVEFVVQTGEGIASGQGSDPKMMIRFSDDGGRTYSAEEWHDLGVGGDYHKTVILFNQGSAFQRIYELIYSEPTPFSLIDANADISLGI